MKEQTRHLRAGLSALLLSTLLVVSCSSTNNVREIGEIRFIETPEGTMAEFEKGKKMDVRLLDALSSKEIQSGHRFRAETSRAVTAKGMTVIPAGSVVKGTVAEVKPPKMGLLKAKIELHFDELDVGDRSIPIDGEVALDMGKLAKKAGKSAGTSVAKEIAKRAFPVIGQVFLAIDVANGVKYVFSDKHVTIKEGTEVDVKLQKAALIPIRQNVAPPPTPVTGEQSEEERP